MGGQAVHVQYMLGNPGLTNLFGFPSLSGQFCLRHQCKRSSPLLTIPTGFPSTSISGDVESLGWFSVLHAGAIFQIATTAPVNPHIQAFELSDKIAPWQHSF